MKSLHRYIHSLVVLLVIVLFALPFFWFSPNQLEMGGDSNRLFLYDPVSYLKSNALFSVEPEGVGKLRPDHAILPFMLILVGINTIVHSPFILMCILNGLKLSGSFIFIYLIVKEMMRHLSKRETTIYENMASILSGLFYALSPSVGENFRTALLTHNQVFLNPMIFYLLLQYLITQQNKYMWILLFMTIVFAPNFSLMAPPPPFSFYPLAFTFLFLYVGMYLKIPIPWKKLCVWFSIFVGLHIFHFIPEILYIFDPGSLVNLRLFSETVNRNEGLEYFNGILWYGKVISNIFIIHVGESMKWVSLLLPFVIVLGFIMSPKRKHVLSLIGLFFLITLFLMSANITHLGVSFYRMLISFSAFSMFRNFYGQFQWVHTFFYSLLLGITSYYVLGRLKMKYAIIAFILLCSACIYTGWPYLTGSIFTKSILSSKGMTSVIEIDPDYQKALDFIKVIADDGKIINFPFTDFSYQLVSGVNNGAYIGPSMISYLTEKRNFAGYQNIMPFSDVFFSLIEKKDYTSIKKLFGILNIHYVFYIKSAKAYTDYFPIIPFSILQKSVPNQKSLNVLVENLVTEKVFEQGEYVVYKVDDSVYLPHFYVPQAIVPYDEKNDGLGTNASFYISDTASSMPTGYINRDVCGLAVPTTVCNQDIVHLSKNIPTIRYTRINPTKYTVHVSGATEPFVLVFSDQFHRSWNVYPQPLEYGSIQKSKSVSEAKHFMINGYANGWYMSGDDIVSPDGYELIIELSTQRITNGSFVVSFIILCFFVMYGITLLKQ